MNKSSWELRLWGDGVLPVKAGPQALHCTMGLLSFGGQGPALPCRSLLLEHS